MNENENMTQQYQNNDNGYKSYAPNNYNGPVVVADAIPKKSGACAVTSLVCGIISILAFWSVAPSLIIAIVGLVFGIVNFAKRNPQKGMAIAGIITSLLGLLLSAAMVVIYVAAASYL
ncbi:MAG: DUF4190 domain-containing protein [Lachnospiraceae bacterium]|nr:DUF4190 domain-containing protein [Lachnospiraceae bacterium]